MTGTSGIRAVCGGCGAAYRVPAAGKTYACKRCGESVRAAEDATAPQARAAPPEHGSLHRTCADCHAVLPTDVRFCPECGAADPGAPGVAPVVASGARPSAPSSLAERRLAAHDLGQARRAIRVVRGIFWFYVVAFCLGIAGGLGFLHLEAPVDPAPALILVGMFTLLALLALLGANLAARHPFACSVTIASFWSLAVAMQLVQGEFRIVPTAIAAALWLLVIPTVRVAKLLREHPDLYVARRMLGASPVEAMHRQEAPAGTQRRTWVRFAAQAAALLVATTLATAGVLRERPSSPAGNLAELVAAWNRADAEALVALYPAARRAAERERLAAALARRGWDPAWPTLEAFDAATLAPVAATDAVTGHRYRFADGGLSGAELRTEWHRDGGSWVLAALRLPPPPLEPALAAFADAWPRPDALAALYPERKRDTQGSLERLAEIRGWTATPPVLGPAEVREIDADSREVRYALGTGHLRTRWTLVLDEDRWYLTVLDPRDK